MRIVELGKRRNNTSADPAVIANITLEYTIDDVNLKWGVHKANWASRFSSDRKMFFVGNMDGTAANWSLNCPTPNIPDWTLGTKGIVQQMRSIHISPDGTKVFGDIFKFRRWALSTPSDLTTAVLDQEAPILDWIYGQYISPDGKTLIASYGNTTDAIYEYSLGTAFSVASMTQVRNLAPGFEPNGMSFYNEGKNFVMSGGDAGKFYRGTVTTPYTIEGLVLEVLFDATILPGTSGVGIRNIEIDEINKKLYVLDAYGKMWQLKYENV